MEEGLLLFGTASLAPSV